MKKILSFINANAIIASFITLSINLIIQIVFRKNDRKYSSDQENKAEKKREFENKAELNIRSNIVKDDSIQCIKVIISDFKIELSEDKNDVDFYYPQNILKKEKYKHLIFYIQNIGNADINQLDICVTSQKNMMLCDINNLEIYVKNKLINYNCLYDRKILKQEIIKVDIAYLENSKIFSLLCSELEILFRDSYGNLYIQPFFLQHKNLYEPKLISGKEYNSHIRTDDAIEYFKKYLKW